MSIKRLFFIGKTVSLTLLVVVINLTLLSHQPARASLGILYVAPGGDCGGATPCYSNVQAAVDAAASGAQVLITDLSDYRLDIARQCGLEAISNAKGETLAQASQRVFGKNGFDVAFECVGVEATITALIDSIQKGGTIIIVGVFGDKPRINLALVQDRELNLRGTLMYQRQDYKRAIELIASDGIITGPLVSKHFSMDNYIEAYRFIEKFGDKSMKVVIDVA